MSERAETLENVKINMKLTVPEEVVIVILLLKASTGALSPSVSLKSLLLS